MRRAALAFVTVLALGLTGCDHGSSHHQAAAPPSPYTPGMLQRAFARVGLPLTGRPVERFLRDFGGVPGRYAALFTAKESDEVRVTVYPEPPKMVLGLEVRDGRIPVIKTAGNVVVEYPKGSPKAFRVLLALTLLGSDSRANSRYWQGTDSTGAAYCVEYDRNGAGGSVSEGTCPKH